MTEPAGILDDVAEWLERTGLFADTQMRYRHERPEGVKK
jgi:hypothetical protein